MQEYEQQIRDQFLKTIHDDLQSMINEREQQQANHGIACFSERIDDLLLWSHYSDGHKGFCLEFDTKYEPFDKALPVTYTTKLPTIGAAKILDVKQIASVQEMLRPFYLTKFKTWAYEKEWRILHLEGNQVYRYGVDALTGVYFGCEMPRDHIEILSIILTGSPTQLYRMQRSTSKFEVEPRAVDYVPYDYSSGAARGRIASAEEPNRDSLKYLD